MHSRPKARCSSTGKVATIVQVLLVFAALGLFIAMPDRVMIELQAHRYCHDRALRNFGEGYEQKYTAAEWFEWFAWCRDRYV